MSITVRELKKVELAIDEISRRADTLDPSDPFEAKTLQADAEALSEHVSSLEQIYRRSRIAEIGLRIIQ